MSFFFINEIMIDNNKNSKFFNKIKISTKQELLLSFSPSKKGVIKENMNLLQNAGLKQVLHDQTVKILRTYILYSHV